MRAIALRASKKAEILRSKRNRGDSLAGASIEMEREASHNDICISHNSPALLAAAISCNKSILNKATISN